MEEPVQASNLLCPECGNWLGILKDPVSPKNPEIEWLIPSQRKPEAYVCPFCKTESLIILLLQTLKL